MLRSLRIYLSWLAMLVSVSLSWSSTAQDLKVTRAPVGTPITVSAGQEFYAETALEEVPAYKLEKPFKSSMAGSMGLPFAFSIDTDLLVRVKKSDLGWEYFIPANGRFRAYHGLLGSVIRQGDTVGLRVGPQGEMEWFVDNSIYNGMTTVWSRRVKDKDPKLTRIMTKATEPTGESVERLIYMGFSDDRHVRVRLERLLPTGPVRDEFTFPVDNQGQGVGAVRGAEFTIAANPTKATIVVTKSMTSDLGARP